jgi:hypothetical protein
MKNRFGFQHRQANQPNVTSDTIKPSSHLSKGNPQPQQQPNKKRKNQESSNPKQDASFIRIETTLLLDSGLLAYSTITNNLKNDYLIFIVLQSLFL